MFTINRVVLLSIILIVIVSSPQISVGKVFKSMEFLKWDRESQDYYIRTSVGMASLVSAQSDKTHAKCLDNWYSAEKPANDLVLTAMARFPEFHPRGVILAVMQKQCGSFDPSKR